MSRDPSKPTPHSFESSLSSLIDESVARDLENGRSVEGLVMARIAGHSPKRMLADQEIFLVRRLSAAAAALLIALISLAWLTADSDIGPTGPGPVDSVDVRGSDSSDVVLMYEEEDPSDSVDESSVLTAVLIGGFMP